MRRPSVWLTSTLVAAFAACLAAGGAYAAERGAAPTEPPGLTARLSALGGTLLEATRLRVLEPARRAATDALADPQPRQIYERARATTRELAVEAAAHVIAPAARGAVELLAGPTAARSYAAAGTLAKSFGEAVRGTLIEPMVAEARAAFQPARTTANDPFRSLIPDASPSPGDVPPRSPELKPAALTDTIPGFPADQNLGALEGGDPFETYNRMVFSLNHGLRDRFFDPLTDWYLRSTSKAVQASVRNFFGNLREPVTIVSSLLEGELADAGNASARFGINTVVGIAGLFDPATRLGFPARPRNLEETLCVYGLPAGPYLVLPILGPATLRDAVGRLAAVAAYYEVMGAGIYVPYRVTDVALQYADLRDRIAFINSMSIDPYVAQKQLYLTTRSLSCGRQAAIDREFFTK